jgi:hypothetical protein
MVTAGAIKLSTRRVMRLYANDLIQSIAGKCAEFANFTTGCLCFHNLVGIYYLAISILYPLYILVMLLMRAVNEREYASTLLGNLKMNHSDSLCDILG